MDDKELSQRIKKLIKKGFDVKLISLELEIPYEFVEKCRQELLVEEQEQSKSRPIRAADPKSYLKMQTMRKKYKTLFLGKDDDEDENDKNNQKSPKNKKLTDKELKEAEEIIASIQQKIGQIDPTSRMETRRTSISILEDIRKLQEYNPLPYEMAEQFRTIVLTLYAHGIRHNAKDDQLIYKINNAKKMSINFIIQSIEAMAEEATSIEQLREVQKKLTLELEKERRIEISALRSRIQRKISDLQLKIAMDKMKSVPPNLSGIIDKLLNDEMDIQEANKIIEEEAKNRVASRPKSKFAATEEQEKRQIGMQIKTAIMENPDKYNMKNPELAIQKIHQLLGGEQGDAIRVIVTNLIGKKHYETAKRICRKFGQLDTQRSNNNLITYIRRLQEDIRNAEISDMVLRGINMNGTQEQLGAYYEAIDTGIKRGNVNLSSISLGKSQDGQRKITLADIWLPEKPQKGIRR